MDPATCVLCNQPSANCLKANRRATSCSINMTGFFDQRIFIPCHFRTRINEIADKWLVAKTMYNHLFDLSVLKTETRTMMCGPYWKSFVNHQNIHRGDVVTLQLLSALQTTEDDGNVEAEEGGDMAEEDVSDGMIYMEVMDGSGNLKPRISLHGLTLSEVPAEVRKTLHNAVFSDVKNLDEKNMSLVVWEMYKELHKYYENEFYYVPYPHLKYYILTFTKAEKVKESLFIPKSILRGYKYPVDGTVLYWNRKMKGEPISAEYRTMNDVINCWLGFGDMCIEMNLWGLEVLLIRIEVRETCLAVEVEDVGYNSIRDLLL